MTISMRAVLRSPEFALAALGVAVMTWLGLTGFAFSDYDDEAAGPVNALAHGHLHTFFQSAPAYGGSLLLRSPFALLPQLWGGGELATFRALALPCLIAGAVLGVVLTRLRRATFGDAPWGYLIVLLAAANPVTLRALDTGHPEELLGGVLCVGAVLTALRQQPWVAGLLLGAAVGNKAWAVLAIGPVLLALDGQRGIAVLTSAAVATLLVVPFHLAGGGPAVAGSNVSAIFQPWQIWWPLGDPNAVVHGLSGDLKVDYRGAPGWIGPIPHPLIAAVWIPVCAVWRLRTTRRGPGADILLLFALLMLLRCVLDPWNNVYYSLPFLLALLAWEALSSRRPPVASLAAVTLIWISFQELPGRVSPDAQCAFYLAWAVPAVAVMAAMVFRVRVPRRRAVARATAPSV